MCTISLRPSDSSIIVAPHLRQTKKKLPSLSRGGADRFFFSPFAAEIEPFKSRKKGRRQRFILFVCLSGPLTRGNGWKNMFVSSFSSTSAASRRWLISVLFSFLLLLRPILPVGTSLVFFFFFCPYFFIGSKWKRETEIESGMIFRVVYICVVVDSTLVVVVVGSAGHRTQGSRNWTGFYHQ